MPRRPKPQPCKAARRRPRTAPVSEDEIPADIEEFRRMLARRIHMFLNRWHGCPEPVCRRSRRCLAPRIACSNVRPTRPLTADEEARATAELYRALQAFAGERGEA